MNTTEVQQVLSQIRALQTQAAGRPAAAGPVAPASGTGSFGALMKSALDNVNGTQAAAQKLQESFERGDSSTDLASVMLASSKAQVSFKAVVEVRNRLVSAYQDIMNMPL